MAKKNFNNFLNQVKPVSKLDPAAIDAMTREVHAETAAQPAPPAQPKPAPAARAVPAKTPATPKVPNPAPKTTAPAEQGRRGRKPKPRTEGRLVRVSVDLPENLFIALSAQCIREKTDKMAYIRNLVERDLRNR